MLISVTLENWMSFRDPTTFSMVAGSEEDHADRLYSPKGHNFKLLPIAVIFGGNASGKSNLLKSIGFAINLLRGQYNDNNRLPVKPFKLAKKNLQSPSSFILKFLTGNDVFEYSFSATESIISHEKLINIKANGSKETWFEFTAKSNVSIEFPSKPPFSKAEEKGYLTGLLKNKKPTQLFLNFAIQTGIKLYENIFKDLASIQLLSPDIGVAPRQLDNYNKIVPLMDDMDTGIVNLKIEDLSDAELGIPVELKDMWANFLEKSPLSRGDSIPLPHDPTKFLVKTKNGIIAKRLRSYHKGDAGEVPFDINSEESDGTQRLLQIAPILLPLFSNSKKTEVLFIDELNRSLHSLLTREIIALYLEKCDKNSEKQFIFTTHDIDILDQDCFRLDEIKLVRRKKDGGSTISSLANEGIENRKNLRENYLDGYFGGVPHIFGGDY